jgi:ferrochelatase
MRAMATVVPPVAQDKTSSKGPTAIVFMNMGGPSTTDEVQDFLSRLFVRLASSCKYPKTFQS